MSYGQRRSEMGALSKSSFYVFDHNKIDIGVQRLSDRLPF
jgi:hypothetical protein